MAPRVSRDLHRSLTRHPGVTIVASDAVHAVEAATVRTETGPKLPHAAVIATARLADAVGIIGNDRRRRGTPLGVP